MSNENAPRYKIISIDLADKSFEHETYIEQDKDAKLNSARFVNKTYLALVYKHDASLICSYVLICSYTSTE